MVIETFKALRNMTSDEADPDKFIVGQELTSSGIVDDADQKVNSKDDTMQLLTKLLGDYHTGDVSVDSVHWFIPKQFKAKGKRRHFNWDIDPLAGCGRNRGKGST